jgi:hypothetical protein
MVSLAENTALKPQPAPGAGAEWPGLGSLQTQRDGVLMKKLLEVGLGWEDNREKKFGIDHDCTGIKQESGW